MSGQVVAGFETPETFRNRVSYPMFVRKMTPILVIAWVFMTLVFAFVLWYAHLGAVLNWLLAILAATAGVAAIVGLKKLQFDKVWGSATLQLSPWGAVMDERNLRIELPWQQVTEIGNARLMAPVKVPVAFNPATRATQRGIDAATAIPEAGLIGTGRMVLKDSAPAALRTQVRQNDAGSQAIILGQYDPNWPQGRIGAWIRAYRPDLMP